MRSLYVACLVAGLSAPIFAPVASAQTAAAPPAAGQPASPEALALAKQLIAKIEPNPQQTINQLGGSMVGMMQQMGIRNPEHAQVVVREAMIPILSEHIGGLMDRSAQAYAETLSVDDLKAVLAFYETKAGQDLIKAQPVLAQHRIRGLTAWMAELQPEMQTRMAEIMKKHGWDKDPG